LLEEVLEAPLIDDHVEKKLIEAGILLFQACDAYSEISVFDVVNADVTGVTKEVDALRFLEEARCTSPELYLGLVWLRGV